MSLLEWFKKTRKECGRWAEFFSVVAGEARPMVSFDEGRQGGWRNFLEKHLSPVAQHRLRAVTDEALRAQIVRQMLAILDLQKRLTESAKADSASDVSQLMLSIDATLQRLAIALNRINEANLTDLPEDAPKERSAAQNGLVTQPPPRRPARPTQPPPRRAPTAPPLPPPRATPTPQRVARPERTPTPRPQPPPRRPPATPEPVIELTRKKGDSQRGSYPDAPAAESLELSSALAELPVELPARSGTGPLKPARTDSRVALLKTYVKRLDREVLGPEEEAALDHVVSILSGALAADEDTLARRLRYLDQQFVADDASLFSRPLMEDLRRLLTALAEQATRRLHQACRQSQADNLLFNVTEFQLGDTPAEVPVIQLASRPDGLKSGLFPSYLPRLRGPSVTFTFFAAAREGTKLVRRVPENRLEFGFVAGPTRLWLTAFHVVRSGPGGILNIEHTEDPSPAYFEARLTLPATGETYAVTQRFVLAEAARFVDRLVVA